MWFDEPHRLLKEVLLPDWTLRDNQLTKGDRAKHVTVQPFWSIVHSPSLGIELNLKRPLNKEGSPLLRKVTNQDEQMHC
jgi:hypothetical protein